MDTYKEASERASRVVTDTFSSSFGSAIRLLDSSIRQDIYNIYGLVRVADEIVDTYQGENAAALLASLEEETYAALQTGFSTNVIVHAFCVTARRYNIKEELITPFFASMRMDVTAKNYSLESYRTYIYGSAEVVGLMCLKVFTKDDTRQYNELKSGACALGAAYQKINFLRDIKDDYESRGRFYFPDVSYASFNETIKQAIVADIRTDLLEAEGTVQLLPKRARFATQLSVDYYKALLQRLEQTSVDELKQIRLSTPKRIKLQLLIRARVGQYVS